MKYGNPINEVLSKLQWTSEFAAKKFYERFKADFDERGLGELSTNRFNNVKLGNDQAPWLRKLFADFFGIAEDAIPKKRSDPRPYQYQRNKCGTCNG